MNVLVDYLTLSCRAFSIDVVLGKLKLKISECTKIKSYYGFDYAYYYAGIKLHVSSEMLVVDMSGKGCRALESLYNKNLDWIDFIHGFLCEPNSHLARLDIAADDICDTPDKTPLLNMQTLFRKVNGKVTEREYICKSRSMVHLHGDEESIYFGSPASDRRLRIYNKALERGVDYHWIRTEFQLRNEAALSFYMRAFENNNIGKTMGGMLFDYLRFTTDVNEQDHNQSRLNVCRFWIDYCRTAKRLSGFYIGGAEYNLDSLVKYVSVQAASSIKTYIQINNGDLSGLLEMVDAAKFNKKQKRLLDEYGINLKLVELEREKEVAPLPDLFGEYLPESEDVGAHRNGSGLPDDKFDTKKALKKMRDTLKPTEIVNMYDSGVDIDYLVDVVFSSGIFRFKRHARHHVQRVLLAAQKYDKEQSG